MRMLRGGAGVLLLESDLPIESSQRGPISVPVFFAAEWGRGWISMGKMGDFKVLGRLS